MNLVPSYEEKEPQLPTASLVTDPFVTPPNQGPKLGFGIFSSPSVSTPSTHGTDPDFEVSEKKVSQYTHVL